MQRAGLGSSVHLDLELADTPIRQADHSLHPNVNWVVASSSPLGRRWFTLVQPYIGSSI